MKFSDVIVVKFGGSLLYDDDLKLQKSIITKIQLWTDRALSRYRKIVIVAGGGKLSRFLGDQVKDLVQNGDKIHSVARAITVTNAEIIRLALGSRIAETAYTLGNLFEKLVDDDIKCIVIGGLKDGWSTDMDAAIAADVLDVDRVYKLSDIDHLYTVDPKTHPNAKPIKDISWEEYFKMFGISSGKEEHEANKHIPIDVMCSQYCFKKGINFLISGGKSLAQEMAIEEVMQTGTFVHV